MDKSFASYKVEERSYVSYIKREIHGQVLRGKFSETQAGEIDIIVSEISSNLVKHAGSGEILFRIHEDNTGSSVFEIVSIDNGPGIADTARMMRDGVSTTHTLGHGLGAIHRLSDTAQVFSVPGWGTIVYAMVSSKQKKNIGQKSQGLEIRALCVNKPRETECGDGYGVKHTASGVIIFFGDGLGHGPKAKEAIDLAREFLSSCNESEPVEILRQMHQNIRRTRGLVGTIAVCDLKANQWRICGVGNILTRLYSGIEFKNYMPYNGTIGLNLPSSMNASTLPVESNQHLIMSSDGIQARWDLSKFHSILKYDNTVLAAAIYKDFSRGTDDASVLVAKVI
jgi:anti-sigma regulatory factor (Ser/Thr protein kinase)